MFPAFQMQLCPFSYHAIPHLRHESGAPCFVYLIPSADPQSTFWPCTSYLLDMPE